MPAVTSRLFGSLAGLGMAMGVGIAAVSQTSPPQPPPAWQQLRSQQSNRS